MGDESFKTFSGAMVLTKQLFDINLEIVHLLFEDTQYFLQVHNFIFLGVFQPIHLLSIFMISLKRYFSSFFIH